MVFVGDQHKYVITLLAVNIEYINITANEIKVLIYLLVGPTGFTYRLSIVMLAKKTCSYGGYSIVFTHKIFPMIL